MKTVKLNAFDNPFVYGVDNKEYLVFNIDNETQTLKFQSLIGDLKVKTANILFKANSLPAKLYEMVVDDDILTFTLPSVLTGYNSSMYVYLLLNYSDDLSTSDLYTFKLVDKGSSTFNFEISSICESNISTIVSEEIKNEGIAKSVLDTVSNYEFDKLQHAQQSLSLVENAFSSTLEKRIDLFNSAYDKANAIKSNTTGDINAIDIDIPGSNTDSDLKDYVENVKKQMAERLKDVTAVSQQIQDEMTQEKQSFLGASLIFQQNLKQERDIISAYGESTRQHMDHEFNEVKDYADKVFVDFSKEIPDLDASIKQVNDKIVATDNKVGTLNTKVTTVETEITELEKMHNEVTQTINKGKPISLYSNSLDFPQGDYDYSGNPNLLPILDYSKLSRINTNVQTPPAYVKDHGTYFEVDMSDPSAAGIDRSMFLPLITRLQKGKTYTISANIMISDEMNIAKCPMSYSVYRNLPQPETNRPVVLYPTNDARGKFTRISKTFTVSSDMFDGDFAPFLQWYFPADTVGKYYVGYDIKIEEGSTATPYQPNLLDAPYYLSTVALGENIANKDVQFPITTTEYYVYSNANVEDYKVNQKYVVTMKATKPSTQSFVAYLDWQGAIKAGNLTPVEGMTDVWQLVFTVTQANIDAGAVRNLNIYQYPSATKGAVQIDWLKIEKGDTRTPNIKEYKYKGFSVKPSNNPNDYEWSIDRQYGEKRLDKMVNTTDPQSIGGIKNFLETPLVNGKEVLYGDRLFEGFYGSGTLHTSFKTKTRLGVGGLVMDDQPRLPEPFEWNSGRWQATVIRDVTFYCEGTMYIDTGGNMGKYIYIANWKDDAQTQYASGNPAGMGIAADNGYWYRNLKDFSWIVSLKKGDKFSIGIELATDKEVWNIQIRTLHIKELIPPLY